LGVLTRRGLGNILTKPPPKPTSLIQLSSGLATPEPLRILPGLLPVYNSPPKGLGQRFKNPPKHPKKTPPKLIT